MNTQKLQDLVQKIINAGYTQTQIAAATGSSQPTISRILTGVHHDPRSSLVDKLRTFADFISESGDISA